MTLEEWHLNGAIGGMASYVYVHPYTCLNKAIYMLLYKVIFKIKEILKGRLQLF